jgi:16S rRNA (adenine1518-N6/adenine1519-N6)-dimethyltransferase
MTLKRDILARLERHGARAMKSLGQHFLIEPRVVEKIASVAADGASDVIEIGPGPGTLTEALLARGPRVLAVEKDPRMVEILREEIASERLEVLGASILDLRYSDLRPGAHVAGNLPYNLSAPILLGLLRERRSIGPATVMLQREVADRISSGPGTKAYGSLSVLFAAHAEIDAVLRVPPGCFFPPPKVHSTVLQIRWLERPRVDIGPFDHFEKVVRASFAQRRKMLRNSLRTAFDTGAVDAAERTSGVSFTRRAESLSLDEIAAIAHALKETATAG